jgi:hypothetical protein
MLEANTTRTTIWTRVTLLGVIVAAAAAAMLALSVSETSGKSTPAAQLLSCTTSPVNCTNGPKQDQ